MAEPVAGQKCIVKTGRGQLFPAVWNQGSWVHVDANVVVRGVIGWIDMPTNDIDGPNNDIPDWLLLKYAIRDYRKEQKTVAALRGLNQELAREVAKLQKRVKGLENVVAQKPKHPRSFRRLKDTLLRVHQILENPDLWKEDEPENQEAVDFVTEETCNKKTEDYVQTDSNPRID